MTNALRTAITSVKPEIPSWLRSSLVGYWSGGHRDNVYYGLQNITPKGTDYANWDLAGTGTSKSASGIRLVADSANEYARQLITIANGQKYALVYYVTATDMTSSVLTSSASSFGSNVLTRNIGRNVIILTSINTNNQFRIVINDGETNGKYIDLTDIMLIPLLPIGSGNEPTAAEMDAILAADGTAYWDGTRNVLCNPNQQYFWADYSGNGRHGKLTNFAYTAGSTLDQYGAYIDGVDDFISIADSPATRLTAGGTLWAWIKPKSAGEGATGRIFDKSTDTLGTNGYRFTLRSDYRLYLSVNGGSDTVFTPANSIVQNRWQFAAVTFSTLGRVAYIDGVNRTETVNGEVPSLPPDVAGVVAIGNRAGNTDLTFDGQIGLAGICNRALTASEIRYLFDSTRRRYGI